MDVISKNELKNIIMNESNPSISIYLPTHEEWNQMDQDKIRYKNALSTVKNKLTNDKFDFNIDQFIEPAETLLSDKDFWNHQSKGLAVLLSKGLFQIFRLSNPVDEKVYIEDKFYIKPLAREISRGNKCYMLSVNLKNMKLYEADKYELKEVEIDKPLTNIDDYLSTYDQERSIQYHTGSGGSSGEKTAIFHGQGTSVDDKRKKKYILEYFRFFDNRLAKIIEDKNLPLLLVGLKYLLPIYLKATSYSNTMENGIEINPEDLSDKELHKKAKIFMQKYFEKSIKDIIEKYNKSYSTKNTSDDLNEIIKAAFEGKIDTLLLNYKYEKKGIYNSKNHEIEIEESKSKNNYDLINIAVRETILNDGSVYLLEDNEFIENYNIAALLRY